MKRRPKKEELLAQFYEKESRAESVKRRLSGAGRKVPIVPILVVVMLLIVVGLSALLVSESSLEFDFASYEPRPRSPAGWSDDQRLTDSSYPDQAPAIAVEGDKVHVVWNHQNTSGNSKYDIYYRNSTDAGFSWSSSTLLSRGEEEYISRNPDVGVSNDNIHVVWHRYKVGFPAEQREIYYRNSTDGGLSWNERKMLSEDEGNHSQAPHIVMSGDNIHIVWNDDRHGDPNRRELYYLRSTDGGKTWDDGNGGEYGKRLTNSDAATAIEDIGFNYPNVHIVYSDDRDGDNDIYYQMSSDNGVTWQDGQGNVGSEFKLAESSNEFYPAALAVNGSTVHVVWMEYDGSDYYIWYRNSTDNGGSWGSAQRLVGPTPQAGATELACNESHIYMIWNDQRDDGTHSEVYIMNSTNSGGDWGAETRLTEVDNEHSGGPDICLSDGNKYVVWIDLRDGNDEIYFKRSPDFISVPEFPNLLLPITLTILTYVLVSEYKTKKWRKKHENE